MSPALVVHPVGYDPPREDDVAKLVVALFWRSKLPLFWSMLGPKMRAPENSPNEFWSVAVPVRPIVPLMVKLTVIGVTVEASAPAIA